MKGSANLNTRIIRSSVDWSSVGLTLEAMLAGRFTYRSLAEWQERIGSGEITLNGQLVPPDTILKLHDIIEYHPADIPEPPADLNYRIVFEDAHLLVVEKPGNLCVHPSGPFFKNTLWHLLTSRFGAVHLINRLDRETSGLMLAAKDPTTAAKLSGNDRAIRKEYRVIVHGTFDQEVQADGFLVSDTASAVRKKRRFVPGERPPTGAAQIERCSTRLFPIRCGKEFSLVGAELGTGRMHQIRATMFSLGFPVVGDKLYGLDEQCFLKLRSNGLTDGDRAKLRLTRQALHAAILEMRHPETDEEMHWESPLPPELKTCLSWISPQEP